MPTHLDDIDTSSLTLEQLQGFCVDVHEATAKEQELSINLVLERDKLSSLVDVARERLLLLKHDNYNKRMEIDDAEERYRQEIERKREQLINLKADKHRECLQTKLICVQNAEAERSGRDEEMKEMINDAKFLKSRIVDLKVDFTEAKTSQEIKLAEDKHKLRQEEVRVHILTEQKWDRKLVNRLNALDSTFQDEYERLKARKSDETTQLIQLQDKFSTDLRHYYKEIVDHNVKLILQLNSELKKLKNDAALLDSNLGRLMSSNEELSNYLTKSRNDAECLKQGLASSVKHKRELKEVTEEVANKSATLEELKYELETLNMVVSKQNEIEVDAIKREEYAELAKNASITESILILEYMASHLAHKVNELDSILAKADVGQTRSEYPAKDILTWELTGMIQRHDEVLDQYRLLLSKYGLHYDETGFTPLLAEQILSRAKHLRLNVCFP